jgi:hypothetical protein
MREGDTDIEPEVLFALALYAKNVSKFTRR